MRFLDDEEHRVRLVADYVGFLPAIPVFSARAAAALRQIIGADGELLPVIAPGGEWFALNVTTVTDALDEQRSEIERFTSSGRPRRVTRFRLGLFPDGVTYVRDAFVERIAEAGLTGFAPELVYESPDPAARPA